MKKKLTLLGLVTILLISASAFTCTQQSQYDDAAKAADVYAKALVTIHGAIDSAFVQKRVSVEERDGIYNALLTANQAGLHLNAALRAAKANPNAIPAISAVIVEATNAINDGTAHIKNPDTKEQIGLLAQSALAALNTINGIYTIQQGGTNGSK